MLDFFKRDKTKQDPQSAPAPAPKPVPAAPAAAVVRPASAPAADAVPGSVSLSPRAVAALEKIYTIILSAELRSNVYQLESGNWATLGLNIPARGYYDQGAAAFAALVAPEQQETFHALLDRKSLLERFTTTGSTSAVAEFTLRRVDDTGAAEIRSFRLSAQLISATPGGHVRCMLMARRVGDDADTGRIQPPAAAPAWDWKEQIQGLLGGRQTIYFEYDATSDSLTLHRGMGSDEKSRVIPHYLAKMDDRCDWTISHPDVKAFRELLKSGKPGTAEVRYRAGGEYDQPFHWYRAQLGTPEEVDGTRMVLGALTDIDDEVKLRASNESMAVQIGTLLHSTFSRIFEIDTQADTMTPITNHDGIYQRDAKPWRLRAFILDDIESGVIHPDSAATYSQWTKPGFLEEQIARSGSFSCEGCQKLPGHTSYRWYAEEITRPDPARPHQFLRLSRDITEVREQRLASAAMQEQVRMNSYNREMLDTIANIVEFRSVESGQHIQRIRQLSVILLQDLMEHEPALGLTKSFIEDVSQASAMHDVGKISIPDAVLNKPGRLTKEEFEVMKSHTTKGAALLERMNLPGSESMKALCWDIAMHHHERYDGKGYPEGLVGEKNSLAAQVVGLVDAYDALVSERCYKKPFTHQTAISMLMNGECGAYSARLLSSLDRCQEQLRIHYIDTQEESA